MLDIGPYRPVKEKCVLTFQIYVRFITQEYHHTKYDIKIFKNNFEKPKNLGFFKYKITKVGLQFL